MLIPSKTMPSSYARLVARVLNLNERTLVGLLKGTNLSPKQFVEDGLMISADQQVQIIENAIHMTNDASLGLRVGQQLTPETHGAMGLLANSSPDLITALRAFQTYSPTRNNFSHIRVVETDDWVECYYSVDLPVSQDVKRTMSEAAVMSLFENAKFIIGKELEGTITHFMHNLPSYSDMYASFIPGEVRFDAGHTVVKIPASVCRIRNSSSNDNNYLLAMRQCESMLNQLNAPKQSCRYQVQKYLLSSRASMLTEDQAAAELFISKRTLARRLVSEGTSFRQLRDQILSQQAASYLNESELSVEAIAMMLHYHDSSNFRRAFKRWFGVTPDQFRKASIPVGRLN